MADPRDSRWSSYTHTVHGKTFMVWEITEYSGFSCNYRRELVESMSGEVVKEWRPQPGTTMPTYQFTEMQTWLDQKYAPRGFANVNVPPPIGTIDTKGFRLDAINATGNGNGPPVTIWVKEDHASYYRTVEKRQGGLVLEIRREDMRSVAQYNMSSANAYYAVGAGGGGVSYSNGSINFDSFNAYVAEPIKKKRPAVPNEAEYIAECRYGGDCYRCGRYIERGEGIWWLAKNEVRTRTRIFCGVHKNVPTATADGQDTQKDDDMAQRQDFTFPYTGAEIAAGLERKAAKLDAQIQGDIKADPDTLVLAGYTTPEEQERFIKDRQASINSKNERLRKDAKALRVEALPYAKAGKASFSIDIEDIEHFGLAEIEDDGPSPIKRARKARVKPTEPVEAVA